MIKSEDIEIWIRVQKGDKVAFDVLYHDHVDSLYNYGSSFTSDVQLIEDAIQEMFINIWTKRSTINIKSNVKGYFFTSLRRRIISQLEKQKNIDLDCDLLDRQTLMKPSLGQFDERMDRVKSEISQLPNREREAIVLKYQEGLSYDDISKLMNLKSHAIYKLVSRGMKKIKVNINSGLKLLL